MVYIYIDKSTGDISAYGSIVAVCKTKGLKPDKLYHQFGRNKKKMFESDEYTLFKTDVITSKHK
jgi:hypothetical protein